MKNLKPNFKENNPCRGLYALDDTYNPIYESELNNVFNDNNILNLAITGSYGSGKSTVLNSYEKYRNKKFLHISLAHFSSLANTEEGQECPQSERPLEGKILNQLIHQVDSRSIPHTRFRVKQETSSVNVFGYSIAIISFIISLLFCIFREETLTFFFSEDTLLYKKIDNNSINIIFASIVIALSFFFIYKIVKHIFAKGDIKRLNIGGNEIEIFNDLNDSYFDKYLDEVLYIFCNADVDAIVFEDIDRFENNKIFERLREINTLVNNKLKLNRRFLKKQRTILRFIYLIKDDIFTSKDRVKFFDYIIPIVPYASWANSYDFLIQELNIHSNYGFDEAFLRGISIYIDEMRLLLNICTEFEVFYKNLCNIELDKSKLFTMITYKNLFPNDFGDLQIQKGFIHRLFIYKEELLKVAEEKQQEQIKSLEEQLEIIRSNFFDSKEDLDIVFLARYKRKHRRHEEYIEFRRKIDLEDYLRDDHEMLLDYQKKLAIIKEENTQKNIENKIHKIEKELMSLRGKSFAELIDFSNLDLSDILNNLNETNALGEVNNFENVKKSSCFSFFNYAIGNGYIDEYYHSYINYFRETSMSKEDRSFIQKVHERKNVGLNYKLKDSNIVLKSIEKEYFLKPEILNYDLCNALIQSNFEEKKTLFMQQLEESSNFDFINGYWMNCDDIEIFIRLLCWKWPSFLSDAMENMSCNHNVISDFIFLSVVYLKEPELDEINKENILTDTISNSTDFLDINGYSVETVINNLDYLKVSFKNIDFSRTNLDYLEAVYKHNMYQLNRENIIMFIKTFLEDTGEESLLHSNYTIVCKHKNSYLYKYISSHLEEYMSAYLQFCDEYIIDEEFAALEILNSLEIGDETKSAYINVYNISIEDITNINNTAIWSMIIEKNILVCSIQNILKYIQEFVFNLVLISFINRNELDVDSIKSEDIALELVEKLFDSVIDKDSLDLDKYLLLIQWTHLVVDKKIPTGLSDDKINNLVDMDLIKLNHYTLESFREKYPKLIFSFIEKNIDNYIEYIQGNEAPKSEKLKVLELNIGFKQKKSIVDNIDEPISILDKQYTDDINSYILDNYLDRGDLEEIFSLYDKFDYKTQDSIFKLADDDSYYIYDMLPNASNSLLERLFMSSTNIDRVYTLECIVDTKEKEEVERFIKLSGLSELYNVVAKVTKETSIEYSDNMDNLLSKLKREGFISSYDREDDFLRVKASEIA